MTRKIIVLLLLLVVGIKVNAQTNLALSKSVVASTESQAASNAVDGDTGTRWESASSDPQWIYIDLGTSYNLGSVTLNWEGAYASAYTIDVSDDAATWTTVFTETSGNGSTDEIDLTSASASGRYVRMHGTTRGTPWGYSLWEFEVYELPATGTVATLSDLKVDGTSISDFSPSDTQYVYSAITIGGSVPVVTATTTDGGATKVITNAGAVPGTTTVAVTSSNGSVTKTYHVAFAYGIPGAAPTAPTRQAIDVISVYSDTYTSIYTNLDPDWGQTTDATEVDYSGNKVLKYAGLNYQGMEYTNPTDVSGLDSLHFEYFTGDATAFDFYLIAGTEKGYDVDAELGVTTGEWVSVDIALSHFEDAGADLTKASQFKTVGNGTIYLDNFYFYREPVAGANDSTVSNITLDGTQIPGFLSSKSSYTHVVEASALTVPTVVVTPNESSATVAYTNATKIPGTTSAVVTAPDGVSKNTITIDFRYPNVAANKTATASSGVASLAADGLSNTRWESEHGVDPQWIYLDLGAKYTMYEVILTWETAYASKYTIDVSDDSTTWSTVYSDTAGNGGTDIIDLSAGTASGRYIRMNGVSRATAYGYSLWEFEVYLDGGESEVEISGDAGWRLLSLPVHNGTVSQIADDTPVQGITGGDDTEWDANFLIYDTNGTFGEPSNTTTTWGDGLGFALYFYNNTTNGSAQLPDTLVALGSEPTADVDVTLNSGAATKYTLVGNPFASNFDAASITATGGAIQNNIAFWNNATGTYVTKNRTTNIVAPWQGFWVETSDASVTAITFPVSGKTSTPNTGTYFAKEQNNKGEISFTLSSKSTYDEAIRLVFKDGATTSYDLDDFGKLIPLAPSYATMAFSSGAQLKAVESLPYKLDEKITLPLQPTFVNVSGDFTFSWEGLETVPADWEITLYDYETGTSTDMREGTEYTFYAEADVLAKATPTSVLMGPSAAIMKAKNGKDRFDISIKPVTLSGEEETLPVAFALNQNYPNPFNPSTTISYSITKAGQVSINVYNLMGQKVAELVNQPMAAGTYNIRWNVESQASGTYYYRLEANGKSITRKMTLIK